MKFANYSIVSIDADSITIRDEGPHDAFPTITNDAEGVVRRLAHTLGSRRLFYYDSDGEKGELRVKDGRFTGFDPA